MIGILGTDVSSTCFKVRNKLTSKIYTWKALSKGTSSKEELTGVSHPNLLRVYGHISDEHSKQVYLVTEFCENGCLDKVIEECLEHQWLLSESFLWRTFHQIASAIKAANFRHPSDILFDMHYNVKLCVSDASAAAGLSHFRDFLYRACALRPPETNGALKHLPTRYSTSLRDLIRFLFERKALTFVQAVDTVLHHPSCLVKREPLPKSAIFVSAGSDKSETVSSVSSESSDNRLEALRRREASVKAREQKLLEKEHELRKREKKVALLERMAREKLSRAELYLRRSRDPKAKIKYEEIDTSFSADCGDSLVPRKPSFVRSMSERRVHFKGHSPLKEHGASVGSGRIVTQARDDSSGRGSASSNDHLPEGNIKRRFSLFQSRSKSSVGVVEERSVAEQCRPISWTEESKRHAFDLLRIINAENKENVLPVKHTYL